MENETKKELLLTWHDRSTRANLAHYFQSEECRRVNTALTIFNLLAAISVLFIANNSNFEQSSSLLSFASLAVVLSTALQYVLKLEERSYDHKTAGNEFTAIKRKIEVTLANDAIEESHLREIESDHNHVAKNHHLVRHATWRKIGSRYEQANRENAALFSLLRPEDD